MSRVCVRKLVGEDRSWKVRENWVYVGRNCGNWKGSVLGNRWKIGKDGDREDVVESYRRWLWNRIRFRDEVVVKELRRILELKRKWGEVVVMCWCDEGEKCHGDVILRCIDWMEREGGVSCVRS